jgi:predicted nucleic acid-binding Zn ribbon protein
MTNQHPITPPPELVRQWTALANEEDGCKVWNAIAAQAAQWGADQELEACCEWTAIVGGADALRAARRPKPPSLKEQALYLLANHSDRWTTSPHDRDLIRRALEALDD